MDDQSRVAMTVYGVRAASQIAEEVVSLASTLVRLDKADELSGAVVEALLEINARVPEHNKARRMFSEPMEKMLANLRSKISHVEPEAEITSSESP